MAKDETVDIEFADEEETPAEKEESLDDLGVVGAERVLLKLTNRKDGTDVTVSMVDVVQQLFREMGNFDERIFQLEQAAAGEEEKPLIVKPGE